MTHPTDQPDPSANPTPTPNALRVWNNQARLSLPPMLVIWLTFLVGVCLSSVFFVGEFIAARWVLGGFIASHLVVFLLPACSKFIIRRGFVSLMHVLCWSPGLVASIADSQGRNANSTYEMWSLLVIAVISISFIFDLRDAGSFLFYAAKGEVSAHDDEPASR